MSRPSPTAEPAPSGEEVRRLVRGVGKLANEVKGLADQQAVDRGQQRRDRIRTYVIALIVFIALAGAALGVNGQLYQHCRNEHADAFNRAERAKVCGQVKGLVQIVPQTPEQQLRIKAVCGGVPPTSPNPRAGIAQFEDSSLTYLESISSASTKC